MNVPSQVETTQQTWEIVAVAMDEFAEKKKNLFLNSMSKMPF